MKEIAKSFDVFISCRMTDFNHRPTRDSLIARNIYDFLNSRGIRTFFAAESLQILEQDEYFKAMDEVLNQIPVLVVVAASDQSLTSDSIRYEWNRFYKDIESGSKRGTLLTYLEGVNLEVLPNLLQENRILFHSDGSMQELFSIISAALGLRRIEDMTQSGQMAVEKLNRLTEIMAESRLLELEITSGMFGTMFSPDQRVRMQSQIEALKSILTERSRQKANKANDKPRY